jgi:hypothetical protein
LICCGNRSPEHAPPLADYLGDAADSPTTTAALPERILAVLGLFIAILGAFRAALQPRASLVAENLALREQLAS